MRRRKSGASPEGLIYFVISNIAPYAYEINNFLGPPDDLAYRFRFHKMWISLENPSDARGQKGLIVMRDTQTARFYPLRQILIRKVVRVGEIFYFEYTLGATTEFSSEASQRQKQLDQFNKLIKPALEWPNIPGKNMHKSVFWAGNLAYNIRDDTFTGPDKERSLNAWGTLVSTLGELAIFKDFDFWRLLQVEDGAGKAAPLVVFSGDRARYVLAAGRTYHITMFQRTSFDDPTRSAHHYSRNLVLNTQLGGLVGIQSVQTVVGKYDWLEFICRTEAQPAFAETSLLLTEQFSEMDAMAKAPIPTLEIPMYIAPASFHLMKMFLVFILFLGSLVAIFFGEDIALSAGMKVSTETLDLVQKLATLGLVLSAPSLGNVGQSLLSRTRLSLALRGGRLPRAGP
jgi:hypothetical protein